MKTKVKKKMNTNNESQKPKKVKLSRCYRLFLFFVMMNMDMSMDISSGIFSSAAKNIKIQLKLTDAKFGGFGTATSLGRIISSFLFFFLNEKVNHKYFLTIIIGFHSFFLFCFKFTDNPQILVLIRSLQGLTQTSPSIYFPVWINQFGLNNYKTIQITSLQLFQTLGKLLGQLINLIVGFDNWREGFFIEGIILLILSFCCLLFSEDYFSRTLFPVINDDNEKRYSCTIYEEVRKKDDNRSDNKKEYYFSDLIILLSDRLYVLCLISRCILHGLNTCLHYWLSDFLRTVINEEQVKVTIYYSIICFIGPLGGLLANSILKSLIGNYQSRKSSYPIVILQTIASIFSIFIGLMNTSFKVSSITILYLIFNSSVLPLIQGILISCIDQNLSATGFAFASTVTQLLTAGTTPMIYGYINDKYKNKYPRLAMVSIMSVNLLAVPLLLLLAILRNKKFDKEEKIKEQNEELKEI